MSLQIRLLFTLFALSGFTGLIYESIWSHYLKLFLGSAAFAQSFVLAAFMGGMALGAWLASRWSARFSDLLSMYGWVEALIGVLALFFHDVFVALSAASLDHVIPVLGNPSLVEVYKYALCALLIVPQTILLGMTFPLMSGAIVRRVPAQSGYHLAFLYFSNSIGAAVGALAAAFWLLGWLGMQGTMQVAGALNLLVAASVLIVARRSPRFAPLGAGEAGSGAGGGPATAPPISATLLLVAAFVTGAASFVYEITWIRMLSLVLGSSFQAFELMLSAFITGLALGGLWIRKRIDRLANPLRFAGYVQLAMGLAAVATVYVYHATFDWMAWALSVLTRNDAAYALFNLVSHGIAFAVMLPATFLAGMTLPLFTHVLLRSGRGERAIGQIYASNTLGAIIGVILAVHVLVPEAGLKLALLVGAAADVLLGAWLLRWSGGLWQRTEAFAAVIVGMLAATVTARVAALEPERLASGVYRYGRAIVQESRVFFYRDGKTASVAVRALPGGGASISTNGKPDASIRLDPALPPLDDEYTMTLLGALPLLAKPDAGTIANIGFGSGLTAEVVLSHSGPRIVDTVEIEPAMVAGARSFFPRVSRPFQDPRSTVYFEDAKSYFARHGKLYDIIISEPSNPWVNGVASLFTTEFYRDVKRHLAPQGLLVQWLHIYELDDRLLGSMFAALDENFVDYRVYGNGSDLVVLAVAAGRVPELAELPAGEPAFLEQLSRIGVTSREHVAARLVGTKAQVAQLYAHFSPAANSDFRPVIQLEATRTRFTGRAARALLELANAPLPINEMLAGFDGGHVSSASAGAPSPQPSSRLSAQFNALAFAEALLARRTDPGAIDEHVARLSLLALRERGQLCGADPSTFSLDMLHAAAVYTLAHLGPEPRKALWENPRWLGCPAAPASQAVRRRLELYRAIAQREPKGMLRLATELLHSGATNDREWAQFLLLSAMLGAHAGGQGGEARRLWNAHGATLYDGQPPAYVTYLANWR